MNTPRRNAFSEETFHRVAAQAAARQRTSAMVGVLVTAIFNLAGWVLLQEALPYIEPDVPQWFVTLTTVLVPSAAAFFYVRSRYKAI